MDHNAAKEYWVIIDNRYLLDNGAPGLSGPYTKQDLLIEYKKLADRIIELDYDPATELVVIQGRAITVTKKEVVLTYDFETTIPL